MLYYSNKNPTTTQQKPQQPNQQTVGAPIEGRNYQAGAQSGNGMFAPGVTYDMIGTGQWGTGQSFQGAGRVGALSAIRDARTTANPEDYAGMDEMRNYYRNYLSGLSGMGEDQRSLVDTQSQVGVRNNLAAFRNANAGRGTLGSRQYGGAQGDIMSRANSDLIRGLVDARSQEINQANQVNAGLTSLQARDMLERQYQMEQAKTLADQISRFMELDQGRQNVIMGNQTSESNANKQMWGNIISGLTTGAGTLLAPTPKKG